MAKTRHVDMTKGVIWQQLLLFAVPIILANFFQLLYNAVDASVVGKYVSDEALAAVGVSNPISNMLVRFFIGIGTGASVLISQFFGRKDEEGIRRTIHSAMGVTLALGAALTVLGVVASPAILRAMGTPPEVLPNAISYLRIFFGGVIASLLYNMTAGILRALGDSRRPLYYLVISSVVHIALNYLFVLGFNWGVSSVAWSTVLSQALAGALCVGALMREKKEYRLHLRRISFRFGVAWNIIKIGLPVGIQGGIVNFSNIFVQSYINGFGADVMAGTITYFRLDAFAIMPMASMGLAITTFVGQNVGAGQMDRVKRGTTIAFRMVIGYILVAAPLMWLAAPHAVSLFTNSEEVAYYGVAMLRFLAPFFIAHGFIHVFAGAERGAGQTMFPMISTIISMFVIRMLLITILGKVVGTVQVVYITMMLTWSANALIQSIHYKKSNWLERRMRA